MEDQEQEQDNGSRQAEQRSQPMRSRWTPKPEQILILESIFNSGMVNPPKDDTVRIRKQLEKFGPVGDANVFYWFQNRRSRSRRRQRQIQSSLSAAAVEQPQPPPPSGGSVAIDRYENGCFSGSSSSSFGADHHFTCDELLSFSGHQNSLFDPVNSISNLHNYQSAGVITVFINGVATEVRKGPLDVKDMFGGDFLLFHSSGVPVDQVNEHGFLVHHGESYFLVPRHS